MEIGALQLVSPIAEPLPLPAETACLVRITDGPPIVIDRTYGNFTIPACRKGQRFVAVTIKAARQTAGVKDSRKEWIISAREIARDLSGDCNNFLWGIGSTVTDQIVEGSEADPSVEQTIQTVRGFAGVFVADGSQPTEAELDLAETLLRASDEILAGQGHATWDANHHPLHIHEGFRRAVRRLGANAEAMAERWLYMVPKNIAAPDCPHCGAKLLSATATVCATCRRDVAQLPAPSNEAGQPATGRNKGGRPRKHQAAAA